MTMIKMINNKIKSQQEIARIAGSISKKGLRTVFTNGCFDILHKGHIAYLNKAKSRADVLIVGLNTDSSVRKIKGDRRPINNQNDRAYVLSALECVDFITFFAGLTPEGLIRKIKPDVLVKGGDWSIEKIAGGSFVRSYGGRVVSLPYIKNYSTSALIKAIKGKD